QVNSLRFAKFATLTALGEVAVYSAILSPWFRGMLVWRQDKDIGRISAAMRMRLTLLTVAAIAFLSLLPLPGTARADEATCHHSLSLVGDPKYGPDFQHFDWVNPDAPKGGTLRQYAPGTFDTLNLF